MPTTSRPGDPVNLRDQAGPAGVSERREPVSSPGESRVEAPPIDPGRKRAWKILRIAIAGALIGVLIWQVDWGQVVAVASRTSPGWLALGILVSALDRLWMAGKWHYLLRRLGVPGPFIETALAYYLGLLAATVVQWQLGGDIARIMRLARRSGERTRVLLSVVFEKLSGFAGSSILACGSLFLLNLRYHAIPVSLALALLLGSAGLLGALPFGFLSPIGIRAAAWIGRAMPRLGSKIPLEIRLTPGRQQVVRRAGMIFFLLTLAEQGMPILTNSILQEALGLRVGLFQTAAVVPLILFFSRLPISVEGIGIYEGLSILLFGLMGLSSGEAFSLAVAGRLAGLTSTALSALVCAAVARRSLKFREPVSDPDVAAGS